MILKREPWTLFLGSVETSASTMSSTWRAGCFKRRLPLNSVDFFVRVEKRRSRAPGLADYRCSLPGLAEFAAQPSRGFMAEREGFEPSVGCPTHDFQSCTFGLSVTSPWPRMILRPPGGESGIRTHGGLPHIAFRVRRLRPLGHFSAWWAEDHSASALAKARRAGKRYSCLEGFRAKKSGLESSAGLASRASLRHRSKSAP